MLILVLTLILFGWLFMGVRVLKSVYSLAEYFSGFRVRCNRDP